MFYCGRYYILGETYRSLGLGCSRCASGTALFMGSGLETVFQVRVKFIFNIILVWP